MSLSHTQRKAIDEIIDTLIPSFLTAYGFQINRTQIKKMLWENIDRDPHIQLRLFHVYTKLKLIMEK